MSDSDRRHDQYIPRRPLNDHQLNGYLESDKDYVLNNIQIAVILLDALQRGEITLNLGV